ncbi:MAG TPA: hypothetical protein VGQ16_03790 [Vicinamibacterales bacterium]|jgi:hypothetical protein|nr:hypothetical protein [Vicinamibacterales bacterium]
MPPPDRQLSTFQITHLAELVIWDIGRDVLRESPQPRLYGRADIEVGSVIAAGLIVLRDDSPRYHVNITGWPAMRDDDAEKSAIKSSAASSMNCAPGLCRSMAMCCKSSTYN